MLRDQSILKILIGFLLGLAYSFAIYCFFTSLREMIQLISSILNYNPVFLSEKEINLTNWGFAFLSLLLGSSVFIHFLFHKPQRNFNIPGRRITSVLNDHSGLLWFFMSWFTKIIFIIIILFWSMMGTGYTTFLSEPIYIITFILIIIVLFLNTWKTILQVLGKKSYKYLILSAVLISLLALGFSRVNVIDPIKVEQCLRQEFIHTQYDLSLPKSDYHDGRFEKTSLVEEIHIVPGNTEMGFNKPVIIVWNRIIKSKDIPNFIFDCRECRDEIDRKILSYKLNIHPDIPMCFVDTLRMYFSMVGAYRIGYAVKDQSGEDFKTLVIKAMLPPYSGHLIISGSFLPLLAPPPPPMINIEDIKKKENFYSFYFDENDSLFLDDTFVKQDSLPFILDRIFQTSSKPLFLIDYDDQASFQGYINVFSNIKMAVYRYRDQKAREIYYEDFDQLDDEESHNLRRQIPIAIIDQFWYD